MKESIMARQNFYNVQAFERIKGKLRQGRLRQFKTENEAKRSGESLSGKVAGVLVYAIEGDAEFDDWGEPRLIAQHGETPQTD